MSDARLSDEEIAWVRAMVPAGHLGLLENIDRMAAEIRHHRARKLTSEDINWLRYDISELAGIAMDWIPRDRIKVHARIAECRDRAIALLDRLAGEK